MVYFWYETSQIIIQTYIYSNIFRCEVYCKIRGNNVFSYAQFRSRLRVGELFYVVIILMTQIFFTIGAAASSIDIRQTWVVLDSIYIGTLSFFVAILPITLGLQIRHFSKAEETFSTPFFKKISVVMILWSVGRLVRVGDIFATVPLWSTWDNEFSANRKYYWMYVALLYLIMEIVPQMSLLFSSVSSCIEQMENPRNLDELDRKRMIKLLKTRVKTKLIEDGDAWEISGEKLGEGVYAWVYQGILHGEPVAVKQFVKALQREIDSLEKFCREVEVLR